MQHAREMELSRWIVCGRSRAGRRIEICGSGLQPRHVAILNKRCLAKELRVRAEARTHRFCKGVPGLVYKHLVGDSAHTVLAPVVGAHRCRALMTPCIATAVIQLSRKCRDSSNLHVSGATRRRREAATAAIQLSPQRRGNSCDFCILRVAL